MFSVLETEVSQRFFATQTHLEATCQPGFSGYAAITKGLAFVSIYGSYEFTVRGMVSTAIRHVKCAGMQFKTIRWELLPLILDSKLTAVSSAGAKTAWKRRVELFADINSDDTVTTSDDAFPR